MSDSALIEPGHAAKGHSPYTDFDKERGCVALALCSGNATRAARLLAAEGLPIPAGTLGTWRRTPRYEKVRAEIMPRIREALAEKHTDLADREISIAHEALDQSQARLAAGKMQDRDLINLIGKADIGSGIHTQRAAELRGEANIIIEHRPADEILRGLKERWPNVIEVEGEEVAAPVSFPPDSLPGSLPANPDS